MRHVVITGGSRGIGFGLVKDFLSSGCRLTFTGTNDQSVNSAIEKLTEEFPDKKYKAVVCDVRKYSDLENLWDFSTKLFGDVDIWINNAGITNEQKVFKRIDQQIIDDILDINVKAMMKATHMVFNKMEERGLPGFIYNMGGLGSDGRIIKGLSPYGVSKRATQYFTKAFSSEIKGGSIKLGLIIPGMVLTDMLLDPIRNKQGDVKQLTKVYNMLAEKVEDVTPVLVEKILANDRNGAVLSYASSWKMMAKVPWRLITGRDIVSGKL